MESLLSNTYLYIIEEVNNNGRWSDSLAIHA